MVNRQKYEKPQFDITRFEPEKRVMAGEDIVQMLIDIEDGNRETTAYIFSVPDPGGLD